MEISIRQVSKTYEGVRAVNQVSLEIGSGENLILLGTSGSGKTTTLKMINRLIQPENGEILLGGRNIYSWPAPDLRKMIGYVIQQVGLFPHYTVYDNMAVVPRLLKWPESRTRERIDLLTGMFNLDTSLFSRKPDTLSGGQAQRVGLCRALAADPEIILLDEPFGALDPITRLKVRSDFRKMENMLQKTMVMVTHDVQEAFELGQKICLMDQGRVQQVGTPFELLFKPANDFVQRFFADDYFILQMNLFKLSDLIPFMESNNIRPETNPELLVNENIANVLNFSSINVSDLQGEYLGTFSKDQIWNAVSHFRKEKQLS
jgi:osmoprotectant transport system ATP-binding protein